MINHNTLKPLYTKLKDSIPIKKQTHIVYKIPCNDCQGVYIGQTQQHLEERIKAHKYAKNSTALKKHTNQLSHTFDFNNVSVLQKEQNTRARGILEMIEIKKYPNSVNDRSEIENLSKIYFQLLQ